MSKIGIVTDGVADLPKEAVEQFGITLTPYYIIFEGKSYKEGIDINSKEFYRHLRKTREIPTTSHPSLQDILEVFEKLASKSDAIVYPCISSKLTKTYELALQARAKFPGLTIEIVDTGVSTIHQGLIAIEAARAARSGADLSEVMNRIAWCQKRTDAVFVLETLKYLAKGGRIGRAKALMGSILSIKPLLGFREGIIAPLGKVRTHQQALNFIINKIESEIAHLKAAKLRCMVAHADNPEWADKVRNRLWKAFPPCEEIWQTTMTAAIATHFGPDAWGVSYFLADKETTGD